MHCTALHIGCRIPVSKSCKVICICAGLFRHGYAARARYIKLLLGLYGLILRGDFFIYYVCIKVRSCCCLNDVNGFSLNYLNKCRLAAFVGLLEGTILCWAFEMVIRGVKNKFGVKYSLFFLDIPVPTSVGVGKEWYCRFLAVRT